MSITDKALAHALLIDGEDVRRRRRGPCAIRRRASRSPRSPTPRRPTPSAPSRPPAPRSAAATGAASPPASAVLDRMADLLEERADDFARTESLNTGKPLKFSSAFDVPLTIDNFRFAAAARNLEGKASGEYLEGLTSTIRREPIGVCASIAPWNYPLNMAAWKIGPALAAGNTVAQAVRADAADRAHARAPGARRRPAARRAQRDPGPARRSAARRLPATRTWR